LHDSAAATWEQKGDLELAGLERLAAELERAAAELERQQALLLERRAGLQNGL